MKIIAICSPVTELWWHSKVLQFSLTKVKRPPPIPTLVRLIQNLAKDTSADTLALKSVIENERQQQPKLRACGSVTMNESMWECLSAYLSWRSLLSICIGMWRNKISFQRGSSLTGVTNLALVVGYCLLGSIPSASLCLWCQNPLGIDSPRIMPGWP